MFSILLKTIAIGLAFLYLVDIDSFALLNIEIEKQSLSNYLIGNYLLKNLDSNGQRLAIPITLSGKSFYTGWMLEPEGEIRNTTPFGGWVK